MGSAKVNDKQKKLKGWKWK